MLKPGKDKDQLLADLAFAAKWTYFIALFTSWLHNPPKAVRLAGLIIGILLFTFPLISIWTENWIWAKIFATILLSGFIVVMFFSEYEEIYHGKKQPTKPSHIHAVNFQHIEIHNFRCQNCKHTEKVLWNACRTTDRFKFGDDIGVLSYYACPKCFHKHIGFVYTGDEQGDLWIMHGTREKGQSHSMKSKSTDSQGELFNDENNSNEGKM